MSMRWEDCDREVVTRRYDKLAPYITLWEWLLWIPAGLRRRAVEAIGLGRGERVLEIGCGTGRNLRYLSDAVGPGGVVYGVDLSEGMLAKARALCERSGWRNVELVHSEALVYTAPQPLDGILFSLSYNTMPHHREVLRHAMSQLRPGGRVVIMDAKVPSNDFGKRMLPFSMWLMRQTFLGNPLIHPWEHLAEDSDNFDMQTYLFDSYYICRGARPRQGVVAATGASAEMAL